MKIKFKWIEIENFTYRAQVIGGWIVKVEDSVCDEDGNSMAVSLVFIPDSEHEWEIYR